MKSGNLILFVICLITIIAGTIIYFEASGFQKTAKIADGVVESSSSTYYNVSYVSDDGVVHTRRFTQRKNGKYHEGKEFRVFYQMDNPDVARISDGKKSGKNVVLAGIALLLINLYSVYSDKKLKKTE